MNSANLPIELYEYEAVVAQALELALQQGSTQAEAHLGLANGFSINVRRQDVETLEQTRERNLSLTVYFNQRSGTATTSDLSREALQACVAKACNIARFTSEDPYAGLADSSLLAQEFKELDLYHPWDITPAEAIALAIRCEKAALAFHKRVSQIDGVGFDTHNAFTVYANSNGFLHSYRSSRHSLSCTPIVEERHNMQRDYDYTVARQAALLSSPENLAQQAVARVVRRLGARQIKTLRCPVIFEAPLARGLLHNFVRAISGGSLYRKSSFLLDHLDKKVFPSFVNIWQEPHLKGAWASANYDSDGVATRELDYVNQGILKNYILGDYSARKLGMQTTGNAGGVYNLFINHSAQDLKALLKQMGKGLLITELMGQGVNLLTGDYSRGAFGFWVENGEIQYPVEEITIAANLKEVFLNVVAVANDVDTRSSVQTGSILVDEMMVAGG